MARIIVADSDPELLSRASSLLEKAGHKVDLALDSPEALERIRARVPDVLVAGVDLPGAYALVRTIRSTAWMSSIPVILLTTEERLAGPRVEDCVKKPFSDHELLASVTRLLKPEDGDFSGSLEKLSLASVLTVLEVEQHTGVLHIRCGDLTCDISVDRGSIVRAEIVSYPKVADQDAVISALQWQFGTFAFAEGPLQTEARVDLPMTHVILEGARRMDEAKRQLTEGAAPTLDCIDEFSPY